MRKQTGRYLVMTKNGKVIGRHSTKEEALKQVESAEAPKEKR